MRGVCPTEVRSVISFIVLPNDGSLSVVHGQKDSLDRPMPSVGSSAPDFAWFTRNTVQDMPRGGVDSRFC
jgi:hypothetical protein